uniref:DNA-directed RNA polymerase subunit beta n=1 Tax=Cylindrocystis brebissonii TaxID=102167 RepID=A0A191T685_9VIRI|nr:beta subunit of RNA polymerase [Cylindrocystis brebissonii]ANI25887.1 beta subunit of RNA polymerase [Cylindrocystis brebissonii]
MVSLNKRSSMFVLPDLKQIQVDSFRYFLLHILPIELDYCGNVIQINQHLEFKLLGESYKLEIPKLNEKEALYQAKTYASNLYVPVYITDKKRKQKTQTILLGSIPLMSFRGTFVINGVSRCILSQLLRKPGIYFSLSTHEIYTATIICNSGKRLKLELDTKGHLWIRIMRKKIPLVLLLIALGLKMSSIPTLLKNHTKKIEEIPFFVEDITKDLFYQLKPKQKEVQTQQSIYEQFHSLFVESYELGHIGRFNLNKRLNLNISQKELFLRSQDLIAAADFLIKTTNGIGYLDDIDDLKHKHIKNVSNFLGEHLKTSLNTLNILIQRNLNKIVIRKRRTQWGTIPKNLISLNGIPFQRFFISYPLSQFLDQTNPLSELVHKRKLSSLGPGGLTTRTASFRVRDIHPSQYGKICPIETAEGQNAGVVISFATCVQLDTNGLFKNPIYEIDNTFMHGHISYIFSNQDESYAISTENCLTSTECYDKKPLTPAQYRREFITMQWNEIDCRNILPLYYFSVGVILIPFLEHDDATRALMGSNMQRQAVPLYKTEKPIIGTGIESQVALDSGSVVTAITESKIEYVDSQQIIYKNMNTKSISSIELLNYQRSNNGTCIHQKPSVYFGEAVKKGQLLADGSATTQGELSLGKNILVAYMPWEGYNFEDAVLINERLLYENIYTSFHIERYKIEINKTTQTVDYFTNKIPHIKTHLLRHLDKNGIVRLGSWVETGDVLVGKLTLKQSDLFISAPENKLLQDIFGVETITTQETCLKVPSRGSGRVIDVRWIYRENNVFDKPKVVHIYILHERKIQVGDKIAGRHGNKGVVSRILSRQDMPYLQNGTPIDMILSPLGVPSRMNVGQVFECLLGLAGQFLNKQYRIMPFDERYEREASRKLIFSELHLASQILNFPWIFEPDSPGKSRLFDGRTGKLFNQPITVGKAYIFKLIHQVDDKIHARSTGPYALVTQQPVRGRSRQGGQRVGEMEVWAFQGFGASYILQELLTTKSDHMIARANVSNSIITGNLIRKSIGTSDCLKVLISELRSLGIEFNNILVSKKQKYFQKEL